MAIPVFMAAKRLCQASDWQLSNLELQKVLYLAHMIWLGRHNGADPLIFERFEAWDYGPVVPKLYHAAKVFGSNPVRDIFHESDRHLSDEHKLILDELVQVTQKLSPGELVAITHWDRGAWAKNYRPGVPGVVIPNRDIYEEYKERISAWQE